MKSEIDKLKELRAPHCDRKNIPIKNFIYEFPNGYGASVICSGYGKESGSLELAVTEDGSLCYDTCITSDVIGWLTAEEVVDILIKIEEL